MANYWNEDEQRLYTDTGYVDYRTGMRHQNDGSVSQAVKGSPYEQQYMLDLWRSGANAYDANRGQASVGTNVGAFSPINSRNRWAAGGADPAYTGGAGSVLGQWQSGGGQAAERANWLADYTANGGMPGSGSIQRDNSVGGNAAANAVGTTTANWGKPVAAFGGTADAMSGGGGMNVGGSRTGQNPYLREMGDWMTSQMTDNFDRRVMPQIQSGMMASGGFGGSRQGVVEANANNDLQNNISAGLANLYGQGFNTSLNYDLGLRNNQLGYANLDRNINNDNLNWQLQGANFGLGLYDRLYNSNAGLTGIGGTIQNQPLNYWSQFSNAANSLGNGFNTGGAAPTANPMMGALGGWQMGQSMFGGGGGYNNRPGDAYMPARDNFGYGQVLPGLEGYAT